MHELGAVLRKTREEKGMTLEDIQNQTKISRRYLEAIEEGDFDLIPGEVYLKGFIVNYANALELDGKGILGEYYQLKEQKENIAATIAESEPKQERPTPESPMPVVSLPRIDANKKTSAGSGRRILVVVGLILVVMLVSFSIWQKRPVSTEAELEQETETIAVAVEEDSLTQEEPETQIVVAPDVADLRLRATEKVWIRLKEQETGRLIEEVHLFADDIREWKIDKRLLLLVGNAGGLEISLRGGEFMTYGGRGQVITKLFEPVD